MPASAPYGCTRQDGGARVGHQALSLEARYLAAVKACGAEARARGDEFRRYTYADVLEHVRLMLAELRGLLAGF